MSRASTSARSQRIHLSLCVAFIFALLLALPAASSATAPSTRVIHGTLVPNDPTKWPFIVGLQDVSGHNFCDGSLIAPYWVITASHCEDVDYVVYGRKSLSSSTGERIAVVEQHDNGSYNPTTAQNDMQLLRLAHPPADVHTIPMATFSDEPAEGSTVYLAGWGITEFSGGSVVNDLREASLDLMPFADCSSKWGSLGVPLISSQICAAYWGAALDGSQDRQACNGDSGGPLVGSSPGGDRLIGIVSFGRPGCNGFPYPNVYTRVASFYDQVTPIIQKHAGFEAKNIAFVNGAIGVQQTRVVTIRSTGSMPAPISGLATVGSPAFTLIDGHCQGVTLAPGDTCDAVVGYNPTIAGPAEGQLVLSNQTMQSAVNLSAFAVSTGKPATPPKLSLAQSGKSVSSKGKLKVIVKASVAITPGANTNVACTNKLLLTATVPHVRKSLKTQGFLKFVPAPGRCISTMTLRMPRKAKRKKVKFLLRFPGNSALEASTAEFKLRIK